MEKGLRIIFLVSVIAFCAAVVGGGLLLCGVILGGVLLLTMFSAATGQEPPTFEIHYGWSDFVGSPLFWGQAVLLAVAVISGLLLLIRYIQKKRNQNGL